MTSTAASLPAPSPTLRADRADRAAALAERVRPVSLAGEQVLPVDAALADLLPQSGLVRGVTVSASGPLAATSLALALVASASAAGSWVAAVGLPSLGLAAAEGLGVRLDRLVVVAPPEPAQWAAVVAALVEGFDVVLVGPPARVRAAEARRLAARVRERRSVLVEVGWPAGLWPETPEVTLAARRAEWEGIGEGWGHCRARRVEVEVAGRRGAGRPRRAWLWLPGPDGRVGVADHQRPRLNLVPPAPPKRRGSRRDGAPSTGGRGERAPGDGGRVEGIRAEGARAEGARAEGARAEGARAEGARAEGARG